MNHKYLVLAFAALASVAATAQAAPLAVANHSFEEGPTSDFTLPENLQGWEYDTPIAGATAGQTLSPVFFDSPASDSSARHFFTNNDVNLTQQTAHVIQQGYQYTLTGEFGERKGHNHGYTQGTVELWAKDALNNLTQLEATTVLATDVPTGSFDAFSAAYTDDGTHAGDTILIKFTFTGGSQPALDVVTLDGTRVIPEPGTLGLLLVCVSCLFVCRRERLRK